MRKILYLLTIIFTIFSLVSCKEKLNDNQYELLCENKIVFADLLNYFNEDYYKQNYLYLEGSPNFLLVDSYDDYNMCFKDSNVITNSYDINEEFFNDNYLILCKYRMGYWPLEHIYSLEELYVQDDVLIFPMNIYYNKNIEINRDEYFNLKIYFFKIDKDIVDNVHYFKNQIVEHGKNPKSDFVESKLYNKTNLYEEIK